MAQQAQLSKFTYGEFLIYMRRYLKENQSNNKIKKSTLYKYKRVFNKDKKNES